VVPLNRRHELLGTYTFTSLTAFNAGMPALFTQHIGNPLITDRDMTAGMYVQDDIRLRKTSHSARARGMSGRIT